MKAKLLVLIFVLVFLKPPLTQAQVDPQKVPSVVKNNPSPSLPKTPANSSYIVEQGDSIWSIVEKNFNNPLSNAMDINLIKNLIIIKNNIQAGQNGQYYLEIGQKLEIPSLKEMQKAIDLRSNPQFSTAVNNLANPRFDARVELECVYLTAGKSIWDKIMTPDLVKNPQAAQKLKVFLDKFNSYSNLNIQPPEFYDTNIKEQTGGYSSGNLDEEAKKVFASLGADLSKDALHPDYDNYSWYRLYAFPQQVLIGLPWTTTQDKMRNPEVYATAESQAEAARIVDLLIKNWEQKLQKYITPTLTPTPTKKKLLPFL